MTIAVDDLLRCFARVKHSTLSDIAANSFSVKIDTIIGTDQDVLDDVQEYIDKVFNAAPGTISSEYTGGRVTVENVTQDKFENDLTLTWAGSNAADALPPTVAALIVGRTATKRVQGRKYIVGIDQDGENNGVWIAATITFLEAIADAYWNPFTGLAGTVMTPGVISGPLGMKVLIPFTGRSVVSSNRTMRTRTIGRGL